MTNETIKTFKQGYPFSPPVIGYGITAILISIILFFQIDQLMLLIAIPFLITGIYLFFVRRELILDLENNRYKLADSVFGLKLGTWQNIKDIKGLTIKYAILVDNKKGATQPGLLNPFAVGSLARFYPNQYNKDETWLVNIYDTKGNKVQILNTGKNEALTALIHILNKNKEAKPYLAHYRKDYELKRSELALGKLELVNPKPKRGKYY